MAHSQFLRIKKLTGCSIILLAARHNHREILAEIGPQHGSAIDPGRVGLNYVLRGLDTATAVADMAQALLDNAGVKSLRKDAVRGLEIIFGLPPTTTANLRDYFTDALAWTDAYFGAPVISAIVHLDEAAPHCHALVLPLVRGRMVGSDLMGSRIKLQSMQADFNAKVGERYGLTHQAQPKRPSKALRHDAAVAVLDAIKASHELLNKPSVLQALLDAVAENPEPALVALGLTMPTQKTKSKSFVEIMTAPTKSKPIGFEGLKPIGFKDGKPIGFAGAGEPGKRQTLCSVGFANSATSTSLSNDYRTEHQEDDDHVHTRHRDCETATEWWDAERGEFAAPPPAKESHRGQALDAVRAALLHTSHGSVGMGEASAMPAKSKAISTRKCTPAAKQRQPRKAHPVQTHEVDHARPSSQSQASDQADPGASNRKAPP